MEKTLLAALCTFDLAQPSSSNLVLVPEGTFKGLDGRPFDAPNWTLTPQGGRAIVERLNRRNINMVVDYEHATVKARQGGQPAPAAGWIKQFEYVDGVGICAKDFEWTEKAESFIRNGEYKYLSPVFLYRKSGEIAALLNVALTNVPNLDELPEAKLAAAAQHYLSLSQQDTAMEFLQRLRDTLKLAENATEDDVLASIEQLQSNVAANSQNQIPDPAQYVPMAVYQEALAKAQNSTQQLQTIETNQLIEAACADGRLTGDATIAWAKDFAQRDPVGFKGYVENLPKIAALTQKQTDGMALAANAQQQAPATDEIHTAIASQFGL